MKRTLILSAAALLLFTPKVSAMTESELENKLTKEYTINGATFKANDSQIAQIQRYLANNEISESDCEYIANQIDNVVDIIKSSGATKLSEVKGTYYDKIVAVASNISKNTKVKVTLSSNGVLSVYNTNGTLFTKITNVIKNTSALDLMIVAASISTVGAIYFANKTRKENN